MQNIVTRFFVAPLYERRKTRVADPRYSDGRHYILQTSVMARLGRLACPELAEGNSRPTDSKSAPKVSPAARELLTHGTGAMEKNSEVLVARRFKRWGMHWTPRGAQPC